MPELDRINEAAQWDYQQDRIYLRTKEYSRRRVKKRQTGGSPIERVDKVVTSPECPVCPKCLGASRKKTRFWIPARLAACSHACQAVFVFGVAELLLIRKETLDTRLAYVNSLLDAKLDEVELQFRAGVLR